MNFKIKRKKYNVKGNLAWEYNPLHNLVRNEESKILEDFDTDKLTLDIDHPVDIQCQPSYDGSTNIIFNDDKNPPRIVNSAFTIKEDNTFERVARNQRFPTNVYKEQHLDSVTRLQRTTQEISGFLKVDFKEICGGGELPGGNYVFLIHYADDDDNISKIVAESGIISVFKGHLAKPNTTNGTLLHEKTDKMIKFDLLNVDDSFSKIYISYRRDYCDMVGIKQVEYKRIIKPYMIKENLVKICIDGREPVQDITFEELTSQINVYSKVKTHTQNQNMLFFGNVEETYDDIKTLQTLALQIQVQPVWGNSIGCIEQNWFEGNSVGSEYFNTHNVYDNLGYMPEEYYRIGIVFVYNDDTTSMVYNLRGKAFSQMYQWNFIPEETHDIDINELFLNNSSTENTKGVFKMPFVNLHSTKNISPISLNFKMPYHVMYQLKKKNIKGYYYVRQARIPIFLAQGFSVGISNTAYIPMLSVYQDNGESKKQITFGTDSIFVRTTQKSTEYRKNGKPKKDSERGNFINLYPTRTALSPGETVSVRGLLCPDAIFNPQLQSMFCGGQYKLRNIGMYQSCDLFVTSDPDNSKDYDIIKKINLLRTEINNEENVLSREIIYIPPESPYISYKNSVFATKSGSSVDVKSLRSILPENGEFSFKLNSNCVRGNYTPFLGVVSEESNSDELSPNTIYNIYTEEYGTSLAEIKASITSRSLDHSAFTAICDSQQLVEETQSVVCTRGDCFTCTTNHKFSYNFLDHNAPLNETMVKGFIEKKTVGKNEKEPSSNKFFTNTVDQVDASAWLEWNSSDVNTVDFGHYVTTKYMSNFNNIRVVDKQHVEEISLFGSPRQFFPFTSYINGIAFKIPDSSLINYGLSSTRLVIPHFEAIQVPFINNNFDNRIAFSNIDSKSDFANGYRVFSGLSYQDIERTYGAIVKLLPYGQNLFCVFEHGCGIVPVNEKALLSTTTGQSIHLYGAGVLQEQVTVISQDYGTTWEDSVIVTPNGIYGVDTWAKKIWRFNANGFELISDQLVQRFLNDNILLQESDRFPIVAVKNVKTHYNNYKGDVMFTFYNKDKRWNLCYNERINKFTTRYSWVPSFSENIQNSFVSVDNSALEPYSHIAKNKILERGVKLSEDSLQYSFNFEKEDVQYNSINPKGVEDMEKDPILISENCCKFERFFDLVGYSPANSLTAHIKSVTYPTWDSDANKEILHTITNDTEHGFWIDEHEVTVPIPVDDFDDLGSDEKIEMDGHNVLNHRTTSKYKVSVIGWGNQKSPVYYDNISKNNGVLNNNEYYHIDTEDANYDNEIDYANFANFKAKWSNYVACSGGSGLGFEVKLDEFVSWIRVDLIITPKLTSLEKTDDEWTIPRRNCTTEGYPFTQTVYFVANYDHIKNKIAKSNDPEEKEKYVYYKSVCDKINRIGFYTHGRAGIYDEIDYFDENPDNQIKPTFWYNKQEPFELEFVVNSASGIQKIFNNLALISNNAEPESLEISIIGDAYDFNKSGIFKAKNTTIPHDPETGILNSKALAQAKLNAEFENSIKSQNFNIAFNERTDKEIRFNTEIKKDVVLNQYYLTVHDECRNIKDWGKRLGNIEYREDKWLVTLSPIMFKNTQAVKNNDTVVSVKESTLNSTRLRDKWCKIRIKYKGDKLVVISAIQSFTTLSYS